MTPKQELRETLTTMEKLVHNAGASEGIRMVQIVSLVAHALVLVERVGEVTKPRKAKGASA